MKFRCVIHGSFNKYFSEIQRVHRLFTAAGIEVLAPGLSNISSIHEGFVRLGGEEGIDQRLIELRYLSNLRRLGENGFSYFVNPEGYIGKSASYELGIAQVSNIPVFFQEKIEDHPAYVHKNSIWSAENLATFIMKNRKLPEPKIKRNEAHIHNLWLQLMVPGSIATVGGIIEYESSKNEKEVLLVKTHKWGKRYSIVGGKVRRNERLADALMREIKEETGLSVRIGANICTFDEIRNSGYYIPGIQHIFIDNVAKVSSKKVVLNEEAEEYLWMPAQIALRDLDIEPNARHTLSLYTKRYAYGK